MKNNGFTLFEIVIVMGLLAILATFGLFLSFDFYKGYAFRDERNTIVSVLQKARSRALSNINQSVHGVHYDSVNHSYIIFQGAGFNPADANNQIIPGNPVTIPDWPGSDFVFTQLTGSSNASTSITIIAADGVRQTNIAVNNEGRINW